jgi:uncharacterized protein
MYVPITRAAIAALALTLAPFAPVTIAADQAGAGQVPTKRNKVIFSVTDNDRGKWNLVLSNAMSVQQNVGAKDIEVEIVVWGPGINMIKMESPVGNRVEELVEKGIKVVACETTMHDLKLTDQDMLPKIGYVPGGVIELMQKQQQGWAYVRP